MASPVKVNLAEKLGQFEEHRLAARRGEVKLLLIDPDGTPNTGDDQTATHAVEL